jgi:Zn-dependent protease
LRFNLFGFPVRITPFFWVVALLLGQPEATEPAALAIWVAVVLVSILIHELGHAIAFRRLGIDSQIVLYHFGGLAIPGALGQAYLSSGRVRHPAEQAIISAAGPVLQIASALLVIMAVVLAGYRVPPTLGFIDRLLPATGRVLSNEALAALVAMYVYVSVFWALLNLLPVYPLDGGQIARHLFQMYGGGQAMQQSLMLSVGTGAVVAIYALSCHQPFLGIMFAMLAYSSYQMLQTYGGRRW